MHRVHAHVQPIKRSDRTVRAAVAGLAQTIANRPFAFWSGVNDPRRCLIAYFLQSNKDLPIDLWMLCKNR